MNEDTRSLSQQAVTVVAYGWSAALVLGFFAVLFIGIVRLAKASPDAIWDAFKLLSIVGGSAIALWTFYLKREADASRDYFTQATSALERAHNLLKDKQQAGTSFPEPDRVLWLTAARLILTAQDLSRRISEPSLKVAYSRTEAYWRSKLYDLLTPVFQNADITYFAEKALSIGGAMAKNRQPLSEESLHVLFEYTQWPPEEKDFIHRGLKFDEKRIQELETFFGRALGRYIRARRLLASGRFDEMKATYYPQEP